jgi:hypothetical protein
MLEQQKRMQDQWQQAMRHTPMELMRELAEENMKFWQKTIGQAGKDDAKDEEDETKPSDDAGWEAGRASRLSDIMPRRFRAPVGDRRHSRQGRRRRSLVFGLQNKV